MFMEKEEEQLDYYSAESMGHGGVFQAVELSVQRSTE